MQSNKKPAKNLMKNKAANERIMTKMTKIGNRSQIKTRPKITKITKRPSKTNFSNKVPIKNKLRDSKSYHNELIRNMKKYQATLVNNNEWFINQLKRNVWALKNNKAVVSPVKNMTRCPPRITTTARSPIITARKSSPITARSPIITARSPKKPAAKKKMTNKELSEQLKAMTAKLRAANK